VKQRRGRQEEQAVSKEVVKPVIRKKGTVLIIKKELIVRQ